MFDFTITEITRIGNIYCSLLFFLIVGTYWKKGTSLLHSYKSKGSKVLFVMIALFAVTSWYTGDFFGYMKNLQNYYIGIENFHLEKVYEYIILFSGKNYILFRIIVWGGALACYFFTARLYKLNTTLSLYFMFLLFVTIFSYARASLAMAIYFMGISLFYKGLNTKKWIMVVSGITIILISYFFHKSMLAVIIITPVYFVTITRKNLFIIVLVIAILGFTVDLLSKSFLNYLLDIGDQELVDKLEVLQDNVEDRSNINATLFGWIPLIWQYVPFYLTFLFVSMSYFKKERSKYLKSMKGLYNITFSLIIFSTVILVFSSKNILLFYRYLYMTFIPLSLLTVYLYSDGYIKHSRYKTILYICGGYNIWYFFMQIIH